VRKAQPRNKPDLKILFNLFAKKNNMTSVELTIECINQHDETVKSE